jgi:hypothetical protein
VEVKSGVSVSFDTNIPSLMKIKFDLENNCDLISLPLYLVSESERIVQEYLEN